MNNNLDTMLYITVENMGRVNTGLQLDDTKVFIFNNNKELLINH